MRERDKKCALMQEGERARERESERERERERDRERKGPRHEQFEHVTCVLRAVYIHHSDNTLSAFKVARS